MTPHYRTEELSERTWPDFEKLFSGGGGWDFCWCMAHQRGPHASRQEFRTRAEVGVQNHQLKRKLVQQGQAHGVLVYADDEPVGWCHYDPAMSWLAFSTRPRKIGTCGGSLASSSIRNTAAKALPVLHSARRSMGSAPEAGDSLKRIQWQAGPTARRRHRDP